VNDWTVGVTLLVLGRTEWRPVPPYPATQPNVRRQLSSPKRRPCLGLPFCDSFQSSSFAMFAVTRRASSLVSICVAGPVLVTDIRELLAGMVAGR
jgi:hypothetical protein